MWDFTWAFLSFESVKQVENFIIWAIRQRSNFFLSLSPLSLTRLALHCVTLFGFCSVVSNCHRICVGIICVVKIHLTAFFTVSECFLFSYLRWWERQYFYCMLVFGSLKVKKKRKESKEFGKRIAFFHFIPDSLPKSLSKRDLVNYIKLGVLSFTSSIRLHNNFYLLCLLRFRMPDKLMGTQRTRIFFLRISSAESEHMNRSSPKQIKSLWIFQMRKKNEKQTFSKITKSLTNMKTDADSTIWFPSGRNAKKQRKKIPEQLVITITIILNKYFLL